MFYPEPRPRVCPARSTPSPAFTGSYPGRRLLPTDPLLAPVGAARGGRNSGSFTPGQVQPGRHTDRRRSLRSCADIRQSGWIIAHMGLPEYRDPMQLALRHRGVYRHHPWCSPTSPSRPIHSAGRSPRCCSSWLTRSCSAATSPNIPYPTGMPWSRSSARLRRRLVPQGALRQCSEAVCAGRGGFRRLTPGPRRSGRMGLSASDHGRCPVTREAKPDPGNLRGIVELQRDTR